MRRAPISVKVCFDGFKERGLDTLLNCVCVIVESGVSEQNDHRSIVKAKKGHGGWAKVQLVVGAFYAN